MILNHHAAHEAAYREAVIRWRRKIRMVLGVLGLTLIIISAMAFENIHEINKKLTMLYADIEKNQQRVDQINHWQSAVQAQAQFLIQHQSNQQLLRVLQERLGDFKHVSLRLLRVRPQYFYCIVGGVTASAVNKYQQYLYKKQYRAVQKKEIDQLWFLEFNFDEHQANNKKSGGL